MHECILFARNRTESEVEKMKTIRYLLGFLFAVSLFVVVVQAEETEETETSNDDALTEEEIEELEIEDVAVEVTAMEEAHVETEYARAYYFMTEKILTAEAVIAFLSENFPNVDTAVIVEYKTELETIRESFTEESDFGAVHDEVVALIAETREATAKLLEENNISKDEIYTAVKKHKEAAREDDEAREAWGEARSGYAHAKATVVLARLHNFHKVADHYSDSESVDKLNEIIEQLEEIANKIAAAAEIFDKEQIDELVDEAEGLIQEAKDLAKSTREEVKEAREEATEAMKNAREDVKEARQEIKEVREAVREE